MNLKLTKRKIGLLVLFGVILFYTVGTGFAFFYRLLYVLLLLLAIGLGWAWLNLRGIQVQLTRLANRGQVGGYLEGQIRVLAKVEPGLQARGLVVPRHQATAEPLLGPECYPGGR